MKTENIHHAERVKAARSRHSNVQDTAKSLGKRLHTATPCSCWMCGNPRKFFGLKTVQERRLFQPA